MQALSIDPFLELAESTPVVDVRSPAEFSKGHIPGARNVPLFDNAERAEVGTIYRQSGRQPAVLRGLELAGAKMSALARMGLELANPGQCLRTNLLKSGSQPDLLVHCWRGGMRSASVAWLLERVDLKVAVLEGGYRAFRREGHRRFSAPVRFVVLGGMTGSGKTRQLEALAQAGEQVIDLEQLARHRGSTFGGIGLGAQPTVEQFENLLHARLRELDPKRHVWIEAESRLIGQVRVPDPLFRQAMTAPLILMKVPLERRLELLIADYGRYSAEDLIAGVERIRNRLGGQTAQAAIEAIQAGNLAECAALCLRWYDRSYSGPRCLEERETIEEIGIADPASAIATRALIQLAHRCLAHSPDHLAGDGARVIAGTQAAGHNQ